MFFRDYFKIFLPLLGLLLVYRVVAVPFLEPLHARPEAIGPFFSSDAQQAWWSRYFPSEGWQRNSPKVLETHQGTVLLFEKWEKLDADRWKLSPLTIVIPQKQVVNRGSSNSQTSSDRRATIIDSVGGAEIRFREAIDFTTGKLPPVVSGQLDGKIRIYTPPKGNGDDEGVLIDTQDLRIERRRIWTTQAIQMQLGKSQVHGRDLTIDLDHDLFASSSSSGENDESPFNGLDHLKLIYVDRVHIELPPGGLFADEVFADLPEAMRPAAKANAKCRGAFHFDFHRSMATLASKVELKQMVDGLAPDTFQSDRLDLYFDWRENDAANTSSSTTKAWSLKKIEAFGSQSLEPEDPTRWVKLDAPSVRAIGRSRWMRVELDRGRIAMANHLPNQVSNEPTKVYLQRDGLQVWSPEVEYEGERLRARTSQSSDTIPNDQTTLGHLWAAGPGQASLVADDGSQWRLSWAKSLQLQPDGHLDRLTIDGSANLSNELHGRFSAETADLWLRSVPDAVAQVVADQCGYLPRAIITDRLHATGRVFLQSSSLTTHVSDLKLWFEYPEIEKAKNRLAQQKNLRNDSPSNDLLALESNDQDRFVRPPRGPDPPQPPLGSNLGMAFSNLIEMTNQTNSQTPSSQTSTATFGNKTMPKGPGQLTSMDSAPRGDSRHNVPGQAPIQINGQTLVAKLSQAASGSMVVNALLLSGDASIVRPTSSNDSALPLAIIGNAIRMDSGEDGKLFATLVGTPARFAVGTGALEGPEIHFNQESQTVWMDHPGLFRLPIEAMKSMSGKSETEPPELLSEAGRWLEVPVIRWRGRMTFDGRVAKMDGGIDIHARLHSQADTLWHLEGKSQRLELELEQPILVEKNQATNATVSNIRLVENVDLKAVETDPQGSRRSLNHLEVPDLLFLVPNQQWVGSGPGSFRTSRVANSDVGDVITLSPQMTSKAPSTQSRNPTAELQCLHLRFLGRMEGDMKKQQVSFYDRVETLLQPIFSWEEMPDIHLVDQLRLGQTIMTCDQLSAYNTSQLSWTKSQIANQQLRRDAAWEVMGAGRVVVENLNQRSQIKIAANRVSYAAINNLLRIEGTATDAAELLTIPRPTGENGQPTRALIRTGSINLKSGEMDTQIVRITTDFQPTVPVGTNLPSASSATGQNYPGYGAAPNSNQLPSNVPRNIASPRDLAYPQRRP